MRTEDDIKKYLFDEMTATERDEFEAEMFANDELFFETVDHENRLVDIFVAGGLPSVDLTRFERSLTAVPTRRDKVANARLIAEYIEEERRVATPEERPTGIWSRAARCSRTARPLLPFR